MAGWSTTTWDDGGAYYQQFDDELWKAFNERRQALELSPVYVPEPGANIQHVGTAAPASVTGNFSLRYMQGSIINNIVTSFIQSHNTDGSARSSDYYHGRASATTWSTADFFLSVNGGTGFRRKTAWGAAFSYGYAVEGDILGPWILEDLQKSLNRLIWTGTYNTSQSSYTTFYGSGTSTSWATAKSDADAGYIETPVGMTMPQAASLGSKSGADFTAWKERARVKHSVDVPNFLTRAVDFYMTTIKISGENPTFDAQGDNVVENALSLLSSITGNDATVVSDWFGGPTVDNWCDEPSGLINTLGWMRSSTTTGRAIARWNVAGGFTYY